MNMRNREINNMNTAVSNGQPLIKYLADGEIVRILSQPAPDQIVVEIGRTYKDEPDELFFEGVRVVKKVYDKPPVEAFHKDILSLEARANELRQHIRIMDEMERNTKRRVESLKVYDQLQRVEDFLAGKITHYVIYDGYCNTPIPVISTPKDEISGDDRYGELKLLALYGTKERTLEWKLNQYCDGSGGTKQCIPCCSLEEAQQKAREILAKSLGSYKVPDQYNCQHGLDLCAAAKTLGVPLPDGFEEALQKCRVRNCESEVARRKAELVTAMTALQQAQGTESQP